MKDLRFYGELITADLEEKTMTFEIENEMVVKAGNYVILTLNDYAGLVSEDDAKVKREALIAFHKWQQKMWTYPMNENTENVVDTYLKQLG